jgi:ribonucleotide monophosphatase NagD (HAD superfamily)
MMNFAIEQMGTTKAETLVVGDRLETDIASGQSAGFPTALVLSGVTTRAMAAEWLPAPNIIAEDLWSLVK